MPFRCFCVWNSCQYWEFSRVSTPPTEISDTLSSPTFAPPPNPQEIMHRRAQSDMASAEIGKLMLVGRCWLRNVPTNLVMGSLVRPPKGSAVQCEGSIASQQSHSGWLGARTRVSFARTQGNTVGSTCIQYGMSCHLLHVTRCVTL
jgi:hypothetical protein